MKLLNELINYANWHYTLAITAAILWVKINPVKRLFTHYLGTCYRVSYTDSIGEKHAFRIISKDPREAVLVQLIIHEYLKLCTVNPATPASTMTTPSAPPPFYGS